MANKILLPLLILFIVGFEMKANGLRCYVCGPNCREVREEYLLSCDSRSTTNIKSSNDSHIAHHDLEDDNTSNTTGTNKVVKRETSLEPGNVIEDCICNNYRKCDCQKSNSVVERSNVNWVCYQYSYREFGDDILIRGCAVNNGRVCQDLDPEIFSSFRCSTCSRDGCNSAVSIQISAFLGISVFILTLF